MMVGLNNTLIFIFYRTKVPSRTGIIKKMGYTLSKLGRKRKYVRQIFYLGMKLLYLYLSI